MGGGGNAFAALRGDSGTASTGICGRFDRPTVRGQPVFVPDVIRRFVRLRRGCRGAVPGERPLETAEAIAVERLPAEPPPAQ